jgi:hypothetical protein
MLQFIYFKIDTFSITTTSRDAPDTDFAGYPAKPKAGYRISGRISGKGRISGRILGLTNIFLVKYQINL